ncbi:hypothetical protein PCASD_24726 [Puccinia coronata f. sp. avenae]|uniref:Ubiquitin-like protease family profile domain-containing protein n=2 Tax=Puccinia coronata f. sp. avenae TaxID=200324 RepID=A0A2N5RZY7_9BASI|nr:hypothetical protein PCASD_24726 [Puccinia coronata f. sp. avenae]
MYLSVKKRSNSNSDSEEAQPTLVLPRKRAKIRRTSSIYNNNNNNNTKTTSSPLTLANQTQKERNTTTHNSTTTTTTTTSTMPQHKNTLYSPTTTSHTIQARKPSLLRTLDKTRAVTRKLNTLMAIASMGLNLPQKNAASAATHCWSNQSALAHVASAFNQEIASAQSFKAFQNHVQLINDKDNQTRFHYARQRNQRFLPSPSTAPVSDFPSTLTRTRNATLETPRPPEPALPTYEHLRARKKLLDDTFGKVSKPKCRKWRTALEPDKQAFVQKVLQQPGKIADLPGAYCEAHDIRKLKPRQWVNDEIVTFYGVMINNRSVQFEKNPDAFPADERFLKAHCFSSFFMAKYDKEGYNGVRRWSKKTDLLQKDVVIFPLNIVNTHWTCAAINLRAKRFEYFDSMGNRNQSVLANLRDYIVHEALAKKNITLDVSDWLDFFYEDIPQQNNSFDCGVFVCQFMDCLSRDWRTSSGDGPDAPGNQLAVKNKTPGNKHTPADRDTWFDFGQENMEYIRSKMVYEIATKEFLNEQWA